jgi:RNA polymerase sigma-70 factor (ECF subfamily)
MYSTRDRGRIPKDADAIPQRAYPAAAAPSAAATGEAQEISDGCVVERVLAGDVGAYRTLVDRYERPVYRVVARLVRRGADAADLTQQTFIRAYDALPRYKTELRFGAWVFRIAVNLARDYLKSSHRKEVDIDAVAIEERPHDRSGSPEHDAIRAERRSCLEGALMKLSASDRELLLLKDVEELTFEELRQVLGSPVTALKIRAVRARARLRAELERLGYAEL